MKTFDRLLICLRISILFGVVALPISELAAENVVDAKKEIDIVGTVGMIADITRQVAEGRANVRSLMGEGVDPHLYKPTRSDIAILTGADIVFYNGLLLEGKLTDALIRVATAGKKVYAVTELLDSKFLLEPKEFNGHYDPHVWMDPRAWSKAVEVIRDKLIEYDPAGKKTYEENSVKYIAQLMELNNYVSKILSEVPKESRILVTAHDAFNYFGRSYNFEVLGIQGLSTESEAGVKDIENIVSVIVAKKVRGVFVESTVSDRNIRALIEGAAAQGHKVEIGGKLFSDAMGAPGTYEGTYIGMIDHNATTIAKALGADVDSKGMNGRLKAE